MGGPVQAEEGILGGIVGASENNINEALENYKKIYINFSNEELIEIESIDLRMKKKIILKYKERIK